MAVIDHLDLETKHIYLAQGVREYHPVDDIYKEVRTLRRTNESYRGNHMPVVASGNVPKGGGKFTPRLATFRCGWKIVPEDVTHVLYVSGEQITEEGEAGPACFDLAPLSAESKVIVHYEPPSAEIIVPELAEIPEGIALEETSQQIKATVGAVPEDVDIKLSSIHGEGSWEGATPTQLWGHDDRKLTSRDIETELPGEHLPSEEQVLNVQAILDAIKGLGFKSEEDALTVIRQLVESIQHPTHKAHFEI